MSANQSLKHPTNLSNPHFQTSTNSRHSIATNYSRPKWGSRTRHSRSIQSKQSGRGRESSAFSKLSATPKKNFSSKSVSKSPNFHSLNANFNFKTQVCKTSAKVKKGLRKAGKKLRRKLNYSTNAKGPFPHKDPKSHTTFDSQKGFSCVTPDMKVYFSPNRLHPHLQNSVANSSFVKEKVSSSVQRQIRTCAKPGKAQLSESLEETCSFLNNFKSLRQFEIPKHFLEMTSFNSQQDASVGISDPVNSSHVKSFKSTGKFSFFKANKHKPRGWKKERIFRKLQSSAKPSKQRKKGSRSVLKYGSFHKVDLTKGPG